MKESFGKCKRCGKKEHEVTQYSEVHCVYDKDLYLKVVPHGSITYTENKLNKAGICNKCEIEIKKLKYDTENKLI